MSLRRESIGLGIALAISAAVHCGGARAEPGPDITLTDLLRGTPHQALMGVAFGGKAGAAVGVAGEIEVTQDGGKTWQREASPSPLALLGIDMNGPLTIAVGQMGLVVVRDGTKDWKVVDSGSKERLFSISANSDGQAAAVGSFGVILYSADRGATWKAISPNWSSLMPDQGDTFLPHVYAVHLSDAGLITVAGELGLILQSSDSGATWKVVHRGDDAQHQNDESLFSLDMRNDGTGFVVGQNGAMFKSTDNGRSWGRLDSGTKSILLSVHSSQTGDVVATGMYTMLISKNDGGVWNRVIDSAVNSSWYGGVAQPADGEDIVVGKSGSIMRVGLSP